MVEGGVEVISACCRLATSARTKVMKALSRLVMGVWVMGAAGCLLGQVVAISQFDMPWASTDLDGMRSSGRYPTQLYVQLSQVEA